MPHTPHKHRDGKDRAYGINIIYNKRFHANIWNKSNNGPRGSALGDSTTKHTISKGNVELSPHRFYPVQNQRVQPSHPHSGRHEGFGGDSVCVNLPAMIKVTPAVRLIRALVESSRVVRTRENSDITAPRMLSSTPTIIKARTAQKAPLIRKRRRFRTFRVCIQFTFIPSVIIKIVIYVSNLLKPDYWGELRFIIMRVLCLREHACLFRFW